MKKLFLAIVLFFAFATTGHAAAVAKPAFLGWGGETGGAGVTVIWETEQALQLVGINSIVTITTSTTVTVPSGVSVAWACVQAGGGGGGGGGGDNGGAAGGSGGGGSSGQSICRFLSVTPGTSISITVGLGGAGGAGGSPTGTGGAGGNGNNTSLGSLLATTVPGAGGAGGLPNNTGRASGGSYDATTPSSTSIPRVPFGLSCANCSSYNAYVNSSAPSYNAYQTAVTVGAPNSVPSLGYQPLFAPDLGNATTGAMSAPGAGGASTCVNYSIYDWGIDPTNTAHGFSGSSIPPYYGGAAGTGGGGGASIFGNGGAGGSSCGSTGGTPSANTGAGGGGGGGFNGTGSGGPGGAGAAGTVQIVWISGSM